jgi:hypothetical protein
MAKVVQFPNGKYGVRVWWPLRLYVDLTNPRFEWTPRDAWFRDCQGTKKQAEMALFKRKKLF